MSYNITTFKVKELIGLTIPVASLYKCSKKDWHPYRQYNNNMVTTFTILETEITGKINGDLLFVDKINCSGEGSGSTMNLVLVPAFTDSTGRLVASCIWENGDDINQLLVNNGKISWHKIDI